MQPRVPRPKDGGIGDLGSLGVRFMIGGDECGGGSSIPGLLDEHGLRLGPA
jgi:hypothetical protein